MKRSDAAVSVILIGLAGFILLESRHLSFGTMRVPQTAFFPKILAVLLLIFSGMALLQVNITVHEWATPLSVASIGFILLAIGLVSRTITAVCELPARRT